MIKQTDHVEGRPRNVQTPTGIVHRGAFAPDPWTREVVLMPRCQRSSRSLRYAMPTDLPVTCKRCI